MKIYNYNKDTKEYISTTQASENPLEKGKYLVPANATTIAIGVDKVGFAQVFDETNKKWGYLEDNRSKIVYDTTTKEEHKVDYIGVIKIGFTELAPKVNDRWDGSSWVLDIVLAQTTKVSEVKQSFSQATQAGYTCTNGITMDADLTSIQTLESGYNLSVKLGATTMDITDYNNADHLALPIADVDTMLTELGVNYNTIRVKKNTLRKQAESAKTQAELDLVVW